MIRIDTVERVGHCGHIRRFDEATVRLGDLLWHHQVTAERDVALCKRLANEMEFKFIDFRGKGNDAPYISNFKSKWGDQFNDLAGVKK